MTLTNLLSVIKSTRDITINLYDENNLLLISFEYTGYKCLDDDLENREVQEIDIVTLSNIKIKLAAAPSNATPDESEDITPVINGDDEVDDDF